MRKKLPIGIENFEEFSTEDFYYVDKTLFNGLKIMQEKDLCEKYMGKFPVISISLKSVGGLQYASA